MRYFFRVGRHQLRLSNIEPVHVAAYVEDDGRAPASVKQHLPARMSARVVLAHRFAEWHG